MDFRTLTLGDPVEFMRTRFQGRRVTAQFDIGMITKDLGNGCVLVSGIGPGGVPFTEYRYRCELTPAGDRQAKKERSRQVRENFKRIGAANRSQGQTTNTGYKEIDAFVASLVRQMQFRSTVGVYP